MPGLDHTIAQLSTGGGLLIVLLVAVLLGLRHATDPDHLTAVSTLLLSDERRGTRRAATLGLSWGLGHATTLFAFGLPIVLFRAYLPAGLQRAAEVAIGAIIVVLAVRLLIRRRRGHFRTSRTAYGVGFVHGIGGSAGVGVLLLSAIPGKLEAGAALALFAAATAVSMAVVSTAFGYVLTRGAVLRGFTALTPAFAVFGVLLGAWYGLASL